MIKILLVEDDKIIVASLSEYLNSEGYLVRSVSGQAAAMKLLAEEKADLVLLDVSLAEGNGFAACRAIKAEFDVPVIFLTASGDEFSTVTGFDLGADDYIPKPFRPRELISRIRNVLRLTGSMGKTVKLGDVVVDTEKGTAVRTAGTCSSQHWNTGFCCFSSTIGESCLPVRGFLTPSGMLPASMSMTIR